MPASADPGLFGRCPLCGRKDVPLVVDDRIEQCPRCYVLLGGQAIDFIADRKRQLLEEYDALIRRTAEIKSKGTA